MMKFKKSIPFSILLWRRVFVVLGRGICGFAVAFTAAPRGPFVPNVIILVILTVGRGGWGPGPWPRFRRSRSPSVVVVHGSSIFGGSAILRSHLLLFLRILILVLCCDWAWWRRLRVWRIRRWGWWRSCRFCHSRFLKKWN